MKALNLKISDDLHDRVKAAGDHGILTKICTYALEQYLMDPARDAERTPEQLEELNAWRAGHMVKIERCRIIKEVLEREMWPTFRYLLSKKGLTRTNIDRILQELRPILYAQYKIIPSDRDLIVEIKEFYDRKIPEMDQIRCEQYRELAAMELARYKEDQMIKADIHVAAEILRVTVPMYIEAMRPPAGGI